MNRYDREIVNWYRKITKAAAEHRLMVDFHGAFAPDGIDRTYPNQITREGVLGEEYLKFSDKHTPTLTVTLPFTRMLAGAMDYTPGGFLNVERKDFKQQSPTLVMNTRCAELAKFVVYESPYMCYADHPKHVEAQKETLEPSLFQSLHQFHEVEAHGGQHRVTCAGRTRTACGVHGVGGGCGCIRHSGAGKTSGHPVEA